MLVDYCEPLGEMRMGLIPPFEIVAIVGDEPRLVAEISSMFTRPRRYLPIIDGPRMNRPDSSNEVIRRCNAIVMAQSRRVVVADLPVDRTQELSRNWPSGTFISVTSAKEVDKALKGWIKCPNEKMDWGSDNLGVGLLLARRSKRYLQTAAGASSPIASVPGGTHLLIACEVGHELAQIAASNLAFAMDATFLAIPQISDQERKEWLEEIYAIGSGSDMSGQFAIICDRVRKRLPEFEFEKFKQILFVTNGFPWGIAVPECTTTHMFSFPDFGRSLVEGIWSAGHESGCTRNVLLIDPQQVEGAEIGRIRKSLTENGTIVRVQSGPMATVNKVQMLMETLPFDIIVLSTHAGDIPGERATYEFMDSENISRCLVIDHAVGFGFDPKTNKVLVQQFDRFHKLDGVDWTDLEAKSRLYVGTAIRSWLGLGDILERNKYKVTSEQIPRVIGSMGLRMHDHIWIPMLHGFSPSCAPIVINNVCSSWHELSVRFTFAGARAYVGTLFPVTDVEAQEVVTSIFQKHLGASLSIALWTAQNAVYESQSRRPYAMVGLPFCSIRRNTTDSLAYVEEEYRKAIDVYARKAEESSFPEVKENSLRFKEFVIEDFNAFGRQPVSGFHDNR